MGIDARVAGYEGFSALVECGLRSCIRLWTVGERACRSKAAIEVDLIVQQQTKLFVRRGECERGREGFEPETDWPLSLVSESELCGNLSVFNLAGYETTASTMTFAFSDMLHILRSKLNNRGNRHSVE